LFRRYQKESEDKIQYLLQQLRKYEMGKPPSSPAASTTSSSSRRATLLRKLHRAVPPLHRDEDYDDTNPAHHDDRDDDRGPPESDYTFKKRLQLVRMPSRALKEVAPPPLVRGRD
jgi:hypothetical protein